nr:zinc finger, PMZ-type [Tanacetum cinerariifolium]
MGKRVPNKNRCITVNLFHDGVFTLPPFQYAHSDEKQITDIEFEDIRDQGETLANNGNKSSDAYWSSDEEDLSYVDFHTVVNDNVVIKIVTTNDPFLNKLYDDSAQFINLVEEHVDANVKTVRLVAMNRVVRTWEHSITPSIKKRLELLKGKQRLKKAQEKDKIGSKTDKNEKCGEARKCQKQLQ